MEDDTVDGVLFGTGGLYEADSIARSQYHFQFTYLDGARYDGYVSGTSYSVGQVIRTSYGAYTILSQAPTALQNGAVIVQEYYDKKGTFYVPYLYTQSQPDGTSSLGSELDYIRSNGGFTPFGFAGYYEAQPATSSIFALNRFTNLAAFDGPIVGAMVGYLDGAAPPGTLAIDPNQPTATTRSDGGYTLSAGVGPLVLSGGTDTYTGLPFRGVLSSAGQSPAISPLTTLIEAVAVAKGDTTLSGMAAADALVVGALKLPAGLDLTTYLPGEILNDPTASAAAIATAGAVYRAGAALLDVQTLIDAAGGSGWTALEHVARALAEGSVTDLSDLTALIDRGGLTPDAAAAARTIAAATRAYLDLQLDGVTVSAEILKYISGASIALQGGASAALAASGVDFGKAATDYVTTMAATLQADDQRALANQVACYCRGTAILTDRGEVSVEALAIGDRLRTPSGTWHAVMWIGHRSYDGRFVAGNHLMLPVTIRAGALAQEVPHRDLAVSPGHALFIDGQLVPAWRLVNGVSIVQASAVESVNYYHIELDRHAVILAEGAAAESFVDDDCRTQFDNAPEFSRLYPDAAAKAPMQPRLEDGSGLRAIQERLVARAGVITPVEPIGALRGFIDVAMPERVTGWAQDADRPEEPVRLEISAGGMPILCVLANGFRADLRQAGLGSGCHAFDMALPEEASGRIEVRRVTDRSEIALTALAKASDMQRAA